MEEQSTVVEQTGQRAIGGKLVKIPNLNLVYKAKRDAGTSAEESATLTVQSFFESPMWKRITIEELENTKLGAKAKLTWKNSYDEKIPIGIVEFRFSNDEGVSYAVAICSNPVITALFNKSNSIELDSSSEPNQFSAQFAKALDNFNDLLNRLKVSKPDLFIKIPNNLLSPNFIKGGDINREAFPANATEEQKCIAIICDLAKHLASYYRSDFLYPEDVENRSKIIDGLSHILEDYLSGNPSQKNIDALSQAANTLSEEAVFWRKLLIGTGTVSPVIFILGIVLLIFVAGTNPIGFLFSFMIVTGFLGMIASGVFGALVRPQKETGWVESLATMLTKAPSEPLKSNDNLPKQSVFYQTSDDIKSSSVVAPTKSEDKLAQPIAKLNEICDKLFVAENKQQYFKVLSENLKGALKDKSEDNINQIVQELEQVKNYDTDDLRLTAVCKVCNVKPESLGEIHFKPPSL